MSPPLTLFDKIWDRHVVVGPEAPGMPSILYVDLHLVHEVTSPQAFDELDRRGLRVRRPRQTLATMDHSTPTDPATTRSGLRVLDPKGAAQLDRLEANCARHRVPLHPLGGAHQGIVHVIGPELGLTQPGMTVVCGDSHTSTHGAFGALAFGIGTSEVGHVLATQCLVQHRPKTFGIEVDGRLQGGATAKDLILRVLSEIGIHGGTGHVFEYHGEAIRALSMEGRMTVCNMSIEGGARAGLIAPDETTFDYLEGRPHAPAGDDWQRAIEDWKTLVTDDGAAYDREIQLDASEIEPMITFGTNPGMSMPIRSRVPGPRDSDSPESFERALAYMGVESGDLLLDHPIDVVFIGSCTNSRISDLAAAAEVLRGKRIAKGVRMLVVPGSQRVKREAEEQGLDRIFVEAGAEWRDAGCSMCLAMNEDRVEPGQFALSTTNRNFEGRQGPGARTFLASPLTAAASAVRGKVTDCRDLLS